MKKEKNEYISSLVSFIKKKYGYTKNNIHIILNNKPLEDSFFSSVSNSNYNDNKIVVYTYKRHLKDVLRTISCELVGLLDSISGKYDENKKSLDGNMVFRSWTETEQKKGKLK